LHAAITAWRRPGSFLGSASVNPILRGPERHEPRGFAAIAAGHTEPFFEVLAAARNATTAFATGIQPSSFFTLGVNPPESFASEIGKVSAPQSSDGLVDLGPQSQVLSSPQSQNGHAARKLSTGIGGLDDILNGGLPAGHLYLIEGNPGIGKTTLAIQFLLEGIRRGERVLYVTLSESREELEQVARSHGWPLDNLLIYEMIPPEDDLKPEAQYTVFHPSEVELADTIASILTKVDEVEPHRLVFDSLAELRMLARDPLKYRRQILALKRHLSGGKSTVLLLDDRTSSSNDDLQLQSIAHGVILMQGVGRDYGVRRRRIEVHKLRGSAYREGYHDYVIRTGGLEIFPRLIAAEHKPGFQRKPVPSGLKELDDLLCGGIDTGTSTLFAGPAGCGKSTIAFRYAYSSALRGERAMIFSFDESLATLLDRARGLGMEPEPVLKNGLLQVQQVDPAEMSPGEFVSEIRRLVDQEDLRLLVIDSMNGLLNAMPHEQYLAMQLHELFAYLGQQGIATIITLAQSGVIGTAMHSPVDVSYLADTILLFRYFERAGQIRQALSVVKKRSGMHERTIRELFLENGKVRVGNPLSQFEGVLTGVPTLIRPDELKEREDASAQRD
jgi:circadian clock protein KaiC